MPVVEIKGSVITAGGDIGVGDAGNTIEGLQGVPVSDVAPMTGQVLEFNGTVWIPTTSSSAVNFADEETPVDSGDHQTFTLANAPSPAASLILVLNGLVQQSGVGNDYVLSSTSITLASAQSGTFTLLAWYRY